MAEITVNGAPVASIFNQRLVSVTLVDMEGVTSDSISCDLVDGFPFAEIPRKDDVIGASIGYVETGVSYFGSYTADDPEVRCLPYGMTVKGRGASMRDALKSRKSRHWDKTGVGAVVAQLAGENGLAPVIDGEVGAHVYAWLGQQDESDIHFLERLARRAGALFSVKDDKLIFASKGSGLAASGAALTPIVASPDSIVVGTSRTVFAHRSKFRAVKAYVQDRAAAKRVEVEEPSDAEGESDHAMPEPFADESEARMAAKAKGQDLKSETIRTSVTLLGDPRIRAGAPLVYAGVRPELDGIGFIIESAEHQLSKAGYTTAVEAKLKP